MFFFLIIGIIKDMTHKRGPLVLTSVLIYDLSTNSLMQKWPKKQTNTNIFHCGFVPLAHYLPSLTNFTFFSSLSQNLQFFLCRFCSLISMDKHHSQLPLAKCSRHQRYNEWFVFTFLICLLIFVLYILWILQNTLKLAKNLMTYLQAYNIPSEIPLSSEVWRGQCLRMPYHYLKELEMLFPILASIRT